MATQSELDLIKRNQPNLGQKVLEIGSEKGHTEKIRALTKGSQHFGLDMTPGEGVDIVHNLNEPLIVEPFDTILCLSVLEHCDKPWKVAENTEKLLKEGGLLLLSAPFQWRVHAYPSDYFRFTFYGLEVLFQNIEFVSRETDPPNVDLTSHKGGHILLLMEGRKK